MAWASKGKPKGVRRPKLTASKHRSKLEDRIATQLETSGIKHSYESSKLTYEIPARVAKYTPDFFMGDKPIIIEAKGWFRASDRQKLALIKEQHPDKDIRLVFQRASNPIYKGSPTTCGAWATSHGFPWSDGGVIPEAWIIEASE
jgi:hypothetical protein